MPNKILNLGSGPVRITDADSADNLDSEFVDIKLDIKQFPWPIEDERYEKIYWFHCIEHIEKPLWGQVLQEIWRILTPGGQVYISYPEFEVVAKYWLDNKAGRRDLWERVIYGRQLYPGDYHISLVYTPELIELCKDEGFSLVKRFPEPMQEFNTVLMIQKEDKLPTYSELLKKEVMERV